MSIGIDYITMPPKSQEVSHIQQSEQTKLYNEEQQIATQFENVVKQQSETTIRRRDVENEELKNEEKENKKKKKRKMKTSVTGEKKEEEEKEAKNPLQGRLFDMKI